MEIWGQRIAGATGALSGTNLRISNAGTDGDQYVQYTVVPNFKLLGPFPLDFRQVTANFLNIADFTMCIFYSS